MAFSDFASASAFKDFVSRAVLEILQIERPQYTYATVVQVDFINSTVQVRYRDDEDPVTLPAVGALPSVPGQIVKIDGAPGDRHVVAVMKEPGLGEIPSVFHSYLSFDFVDVNLTSYNDYYGLDCTSGSGGSGIYDGIIDIPIWWKQTQIDAMWVSATNGSGNIGMSVFVYEPDLTVEGADYSAGVTQQTLHVTTPNRGQGILSRAVVGTTDFTGRHRVTFWRDNSFVDNTFDGQIIFGGLLLTRIA